MLIVSATVAFWRQRRAIAAGLVGGLLMYKPQLGAVVAAAMLLTLGPRGADRPGATGGTLLCVNLIALPGTLGPFLHQVPASLYYLQTAKEYFWQRHVTLLAFFRLAVQGHAIGPMSRWTTMLWLVVEIPLAGGAGVVCRATLQEPRDVAARRSGPFHRGGAGLLAAADAVLF